VGSLGWWRFKQRLRLGKSLFYRAFELFVNVRIVFFKLFSDVLGCLQLELDTYRFRDIGTKGPYRPSDWSHPTHLDSTLENGIEESLLPIQTPTPIYREYDYQVAETVYRSDSSILEDFHFEKNSLLNQYEHFSSSTVDVKDLSQNKIVNFIL
jgi:hypothetical protein